MRKKFTFRSSIANTMVIAVIACFAFKGHAQSFSPAISLSDLDGTNGVTIPGIVANSAAGFSVSQAGDINGDGIGDIIIGAPQAEVNGSNLTGEVYVIFGNSTGFGTTLDLSMLDGSNGFTIPGIVPGGRAGYSVSQAGDINDDGIEDIIIGAPNGDGGEAYVIFGNDTGFGAVFNLSALDGNNGFVIKGIDPLDQAGLAVSGVGDINGDDVDDILIGAPGVDPDGLDAAGACYVVFGNETGFSAVLNLSSLDGSNGFAIKGLESRNFLGRSVSGAGDINGDDISDLIIGTDDASPGGNNGAGESYVIFGDDAGFGAIFDLSTLNGSNGFMAEGINPGNRAGSSVSGVGDIDNDGIDDVIIGAPFAASDGNSNAGECYVILGRSTGFEANVNLSALNGSNGFRIKGIDAFDGAGNSVGSAGDINGDGINDIIIGADSADPDGNSFNGIGESYVVFGNSVGFEASLGLSTLDGSNGFRIKGIDAGNQTGNSVKGAGDVNGDGTDDIIIGAIGADPAGESYVVFGKKVSVGLFEQVGSFPLGIAPNPANEAVIINSPVLTNTEKIKIALFNQLGVLCEIDELQIGNAYLWLNLRNLPAGMYFLHLTVGNRFSVGRIIKQ